MCRYLPGARVRLPGGQPGANKVYTEGIKLATSVASSAVLASMAGLSDMHNCPVPVPIPPHGPGYVTVGSATVVIGGLAAVRQGDQVFEACGGPAPIALGCPTVMIGDSCGGPAAGAGTAADAGVVEKAVGAGAGGAGAFRRGADRRASTTIPPRRRGRKASGRRA